MTGLELADTRSYLMVTADPLLEGSADEYATVRSAFLQYRWNLIHDGAPPEEDEEFTPAAAPGTTAPATPAVSTPASATEATPAEPSDPKP